MIHWFLIDDLYEHDEYGTRLISELDKARRFTLWLGDTIRPFVGDRILELGSGVGSIANQFIPRDLYVAAEVNPNYLTYLRSYAMGKPYLHVMELDPAKLEGFKGLEGQFDTVIALNVLENLEESGRHVARGLLHVA